MSRRGIRATWPRAGLAGGRIEKAVKYSHQLRNQHALASTGAKGIPFAELLRPEIDSVHIPMLRHLTSRVLTLMQATNSRMPFAIVVLVGVSGCWSASGEAPVADENSAGEKVGHFPMRSEGPKTLDPVKGSTQYENLCCNQIIETLVQYKYLKRPFELEPLLLTEMPTTDDNITWKFTLRDDVFFQDADCFPDGKGRQLVSSDVFYSWKRLADSSIGSKSWWLMRDTIVGFDEYRAEQLELIGDKPDVHFDYDAPVEGFKVIDDHRIRIRWHFRSEVSTSHHFHSKGWNVCFVHIPHLDRNAIIFPNFLCGTQRRITTVRRNWQVA